MAGMNATPFDATASGDGLPPEPKTVLIVDDSRVQRKILSASLTRWGYHVVEAESGAEALRYCRTEIVDIILSDVAMPEMNGLELCTAFRRMPNKNYGYFILLAAKSEKREVVRGLEIGADDFLTKPVNASELRARLMAGERIQNMQRQLSEQNRLLNETLSEIQDLYDSINHDLMEARKLQQALVRDTFRDFGTLQVSLLSRPSGQVGGDLVGTYTINESQVGVYAIDVSGHGITAALMTARLAGYLSGSSRDQNLALRRCSDGSYVARAPSEVAHELNHLILDELQTDHYLTMVLAHFDLTTGAVVLCQAGHPHPQVLREYGRAEMLGNGGMPVGLFDFAEYEDVHLKLGNGDRLVLASDGITECADPDGRMLDDDGLTGILKQNATRNGPEFLLALISDLTDHAQTDAFDDDVSAVVADFRPAPQDA